MKNLLAFTAFLAAGFLLGRRAAKPTIVITELKLRSADYVAEMQRHDYRQQVVPSLIACRADYEALVARKDAGETLTDAELRAMYQYLKTA